MTGAGRAVPQEGWVTEGGSVEDRAHERNLYVASIVNSPHVWQF